MQSLIKIEKVPAGAIRIERCKFKRSKEYMKFKIAGITYRLGENDKDIFCIDYLPTGGSDALVSYFDKKICKKLDYMDLEREYHKQINSFNKEEFIHSMYITSSIMDKVYDALRNL